MRETPRGVASRVKGRGAIVRSLRGLVVRVHRFGTLRATTDVERRWAGRLADGLAEALKHALDAPGVIAGLEAADERAAVRRKAPDRLWESHR